MECIARRLGILVLALGTWAGYALSDRVIASAQGETVTFEDTIYSVRPAPGIAWRDRTMWPNQPREATHWSIDEIRQAHLMLADAEESGESLNPNNTLHHFPYWTRTHMLSIVHVPETPNNVTAAQHIGYAQFLIVMGGTGSVQAGGELLEGKPLMRNGQAVWGEVRGRAIVGGETFQVGDGDWVSIPADTPTRVTASAPGGLTYMLVKINAMMYPWELADWAATN